MREILQRWQRAGDQPSPNDATALVQPLIRDGIDEAIILWGRAASLMTADALNEMADGVFAGLALAYEAKVSAVLSRDHAQSLYQRALGLRFKQYSLPQEVPQVEGSSDYICLASAYRRLGLFLRRCPTDSSSLNELPDSPETCVRLWALGWLWINQSKVDEGLHQIERADMMMATPFLETTLMHHQLGLYYMERQRWNQAITEFETARAITRGRRVGQPMQLLLDLAELYFNENVNAYERAVDACTEAIELQTDDLDRQGEALNRRALVYGMMQEYPLAITDCQKAISLHPKNPIPYLLLASVYTQLQNYDRAIEYLSRVLELAPDPSLVPENHAIAHHRLATAYSYKGYASDQEEQRNRLLDTAVREYQTAIRLYDDANEDKDHAYADLAVLLAERKCPRAAGLAAWQALALAQDSADPELHLQIAHVFVECKYFPAAELEFKNAIKLSQKGLREAKRRKDQGTINTYTEALADSYNALAYSLCAERDVNLDQGLHWIKFALAHVREPASRGIYLDTRGWLRYKKGDYDEAIADLEHAIKLTRGTVYEHYHLAMAYQRKAETVQMDAERARWLERAGAARIRARPEYGR